MANKTAPSGLKPLRQATGGPFTGQKVECVMLASEGNATFVGDLVGLAAASAGAGATINGRDLEGMPSVTKLTGTVATGQSVYGVVVGFLPDPTNLAQKHRSASTLRIAIVNVDPQTVYECQEDATGNALAAADMGLKASYNAGSGTTSTGVSTGTINNASKNTTATLPLTILGLVKRPDNAFNTAGTGSDEAKFEVMVNMGVFTDNTAGA